MYQNFQRHSSGYLPVEDNQTYYPPMDMSNQFMNSQIPNGYVNDERFFFAPFLVGGLAGTALGYGIANNNQINNNNNNVAFVPGYPVYVYPPYPPYPGGFY